MTKKDQKRLDYFAATALHAIIAKNPPGTLLDTSTREEVEEVESAMKATANGAAQYAEYLVDALNKP